MHTDSKTNKAYRLRREKTGAYIPADDAALPFRRQAGLKLFICEYL
jgi:hypothetical protein